MDGSEIAQFVPLILMAIIFGAFGWPIIKRKGLSSGYLVLCFIPLINGFALIWAASKTDKSVLDRLDKIEGKTGAS